ncbi:hypothetical protein [Cutibacterium phage FD1]|nr:hypothetical protein [Cutibacterium phage FD1]QPB11556.1 hypothetical protein [Cutibacterium phage FD2]
MLPSARRILPGKFRKKPSTPCTPLDTADPIACIAEEATLRAPLNPRTAPLRTLDAIDPKNPPTADATEDTTLRIAFIAEETAPRAALKPDRT